MSDKNDLSIWLAKLETLQPERIELGLGRTQLVLSRLQLDWSQSKVIIVAGTNGKGSVVSYLEAMYQQQNITTLTYTSPHITQYNERIRINSEMVTDSELVAAFTQVEQARGDVPLTYFEFGTLAAIVMLAEYQPQVAIMEVGLGGRLDAVNVLDADVAVITSIDIDHVDWLGSDRNSIAIEKAGISRAGKPLVCGEPHPPKYLQELNAHQSVLCYQITEHFDQKNTGSGCFFESIDLDKPININGLGDLPKHQINNALTALAVVTLSNSGLPLLNHDDLSSLDWVCQPVARMQLLSRRPLVLLDVAHNPHAASALAAELQNQKGYGRTSAVLAMLSDKDIVGVVKALDSVIDHWYLSSSSGPRGLNVIELQKLVAKGAQAPSTALQSIQEALTQAQTDADPEDRIIVLGSFTNATVLLENNIYGSGT